MPSTPIREKRPDTPSPHRGDHAPHARGHGHGKGQGLLHFTTLGTWPPTPPFAAVGLRSGDRRGFKERRGFRDERRVLRVLQELPSLEQHLRLTLRAPQRNTTMYDGLARGFDFNTVKVFSATNRTFVDTFPSSVSDRRMVATELLKRFGARPVGAHCFEPNTLERG